MTKYSLVRSKISVLSTTNDEYTLLTLKKSNVIVLVFFPSILHISWEDKRNCKTEIVEWLSSRERDREEDMLLDALIHEF